jgi:hypothetical protein
VLSHLGLHRADHHRQILCSVATEDVDNAPRRSNRDVEVFEIVHLKLLQGVQIDGFGAKPRLVLEQALGACRCGWVARERSVQGVVSVRKSTQKMAATVVQYCCALGVGVGVR